jgi:hypothetical protein
MERGAFMCPHEVPFHLAVPNRKANYKLKFHHYLSIDQFALNLDLSNEDNRKLLNWLQLLSVRGTKRDKRSFSTSFFFLELPKTSLALFCHAVMQVGLRISDFILKAFCLQLFLSPKRVNKMIIYFRGFRFLVYCAEPIEK